jgi:formylmethanofuran dehydrogenase subunit C
MPALVRRQAMQKIAGCSYDNCPGVWDDGDTIVVRGDVVDQTTLDREQGEAVVRLPRTMVLAAAERLQRG